MTEQTDATVRRENAHALIGTAGPSPSGQSAVELVREDREIQLAAENADAKRFACKP